MIITQNALGIRTGCGVAIFILTMFLASGCRFIISEPLPDFVSKPIEVSDLPETVKRAFSQTQPKAVIEKVEASSFKRKIIEYRISFVSQDGTHSQIIFDKSGKPISPPSTFRPDSD